VRPDWTDLFLSLFHTKKYLCICFTWGSCEPIYIYFSSFLCLTLCLSNIFTYDMSACIRSSAEHGPQAWNAELAESEARRQGRRFATPHQRRKVRIHAYICMIQ
jgi:hypothetical protein